MLNWEPVEFFQKGCNMTVILSSLKMMQQKAFWTLCSLAMLNLLTP